MERARHRKIKNASGIEGIQPIQKQTTAPRLSSHRSYVDGGNGDDMFMPEMGQSRLGRPTGIPMKKLLAEEISNHVESKRRSPNVIARLMGFEGLPSPRNVHKQQKKFPENYQLKNVSAHSPQTSQLYDGRWNRRSSMDQQEFKDVYEDLEASHVVNRRYSSRWSEKSILTKPELELIQQKFVDVKHLSTDEKLQGSKELDEALEMLDCNKDLLLKFLGQSGSLFAKHLRDLRVSPGSSLDSHIAVLKPSDSEQFESKAKAWRTESDTSHLKREDGLLLERNSRHNAYISQNSSKIKVEQTADEKTLLTRIVLLKPNLGKTQNAGTSFSSPNCSRGYPSVGSPETLSLRRKGSFPTTGLSKAMSKEAREIAREITTRMRDGCDETTDEKCTTYTGYVGDESSYDANDSGSDSEPEILRVSPRRSFFDDSNMSRYPSSHLRESPLNMEAKKRLSERWKMTHKYQDLEMVSRGSTLGDMLSFPDKETRPYQSNDKMSTGRASKVVCSNNETASSDVPLGISSRDGWKDAICRSSSRSRSLPPAVGGRRRSHKRSRNQDKLAEDKNLMHMDRSKIVKENLSPRENHSVKDSKSRSKRPHPSQHIFANEIANFEVQMEPNTKELSEQQSAFLMAEDADKSEVAVVDVTMISDPGSTTVSSEPSTILLEQTLQASDRVSNHNQEGCFQELHTESPKQESPQPSESSKEADHSSPISVLEVPCSEATSSAESFKSLSAELHELRMQVKLLKIESGTSSEEEARLSPNFNHFSKPDSWRTCYALDVVIDSVLEESFFDMFKTQWHSSNGPLDPLLFNKLEKKYSDEGLRSERLLVFDQINSTLSEIFYEHVNMWPWVMPKLAGSHDLQWQGFREALERLIDQTEVAGVEIPGGVIDREMEWSDSKGEIDKLGSEIERLLLDDMIIDVICECD